MATGAARGVSLSASRGGWIRRGTRDLFLRRGNRASARVGVALQALEVGPHLGGNLVPQIAIFFERLIDDVFELGWEVRIQAHRGRRRAVENRLKDDGRTVPAEGQHSG